MADLSNPLTRIERYLAGIAGVLEAVPEQPLTRIEEYLEAIYSSVSGVAEKAAENLAAPYDPEGSYTAGDYVTYEGVLYKALADSADPAGEWVPEDWDSVQVMGEVGGDWRNADELRTNQDAVYSGSVLINEKLKIMLINLKLKFPVGVVVSKDTASLIILDRAIPNVQNQQVYVGRLSALTGSADENGGYEITSYSSLGASMKVVSYSLQSGRIYIGPSSNVTPSSGLCAVMVLCGVIGI